MIPVQSRRYSLAMFGLGLPPVPGMAGASERRAVLYVYPFTLRHVIIPLHCTVQFTKVLQWQI